MIPTQLQIKNFLSYGSDLQTIPFNPYHLICLSGKNGHGKSALLDAITWALWGQARKTMATAKADQGLLRLGETQMMVIFDFILGEQQFRVKREFMKTYGKPYASLEFGTINPETQEFISLTDKTIRATQERIENTIHLDFESFTNSAFLRQGNANEFSKKSAKERKEVLAAILGLNQYDTLRKLATEKAKEAQQELNTINTLKEKLTLELQQKDLLAESQEQIVKQLKTVQQQELQLEAQYKELVVEQKQLQEKQKAFDQLQGKQNNLTQQIKIEKNEFLKVAQAWRTTHAQLVTLAHYDELVKTKKNLQQSVLEHQKKLQAILITKEQLLKVQEERQLIEQKINDAKAAAINQLLIKKERLSAEHENSNKTIKQLIEQQAQLEQEKMILEKEIEQLSKKNSRNLAKEYELAERQFEKRKEHYQKYIALGNLLAHERKQSATKMSMVQDEQNPSCPLCEQNVSATRRKFLRQKFAKTEQSIDHQINRITHLIANLKKVLVDQHAQLQELKKLLAQEQQTMIMCQTFSKSVAEFTKRLAQNQKDQTQLRSTNPTREKELVELEKKLNESAAQKPVAELTEIDKTIAILKKQIDTQNYSPEFHKNNEQELARIDQKLEAYMRIHEEKALQVERSKQVSLLKSKIRQLQQEVKKLDGEVRQFDSIKKIEHDCENHQIQFQQKSKEVAQQKNDLVEQKGTLAAQLQKIAQYEKELQEYAKKEKELEKIVDDYQNIASASGKDGIQALLIEQAIPEIEQEANDLLGQLTNNQAQLFIESLKDLKKGGTKETLDIRISDTQGIRPYELFSGGEAFRIDFALRIAISKLLARRAGTALQTLIIDEGFGSQDEEGLSLMMDALHKIQDNFEKVIIVSHLPSMKEQFPVLFMVDKKPSGSVVTVIEND